MDITGKTVLIFGGKTGLLGQALTAAFKQAGAKPVPLSSADCDILDPLTAQKWLDKKDPDILINAAAYTQVDQAEDEEEMAFALNATAPPVGISGCQAIHPFYPLQHGFRLQGRHAYTLFGL